MRSDLQTFRLITRELWRVAIREHPGDGGHPVRPCPFRPEAVRRGAAKHIH